MRRRLSFTDIDGYFDLAPSTVVFSTLQTDVTFQLVSHSDITATAYNSSSVVVATLTDEEGFPLSGNVDSLQASGIEYVVFSVNPQGRITNLTFNSAVPEPSTWAMVLLGFAGLGFAGYGRSSKGWAFSIPA